MLGNMLDPIALMTLKFQGKTIPEKLVPFLNGIGKPMPEVDASAAMILPEVSNIIVVGAGGTGGYLLQSLVRYLYARNAAGLKNPRLIVADGDDVSEHNLLRQAFTVADLGKNKAMAVANRYENLFGIPIFIYPKYISSENHDEVIKLCQTDVKGISVVVGCVDNHKARFHMWSITEKLNGIWLDAGNDKYHGQVIAGVTRQNATIWDLGVPSWDEAKLGEDFSITDTPGFFDEYPKDVLKIQEVPDTPANLCAIQTVEDPQTMQANMVAAIAGSTMLIQIIEGKLRSSAVWFDSSRSQMKPRLISRISIFEGMIQRAESRTQIASFFEDLALGKTRVLSIVKQRMPWLYADDVQAIQNIATKLKA